MLDRWIHENEFKYLDVNIGFNEITSYAILTYKEIAKQLQDKQEKNGIYKALEKHRVQLKPQLKTQSLSEHRATNKCKNRQDKIAALM